MRSVGRHVRTVNEIRDLMNVKKRISVRLRSFRIANGLNVSDVGSLMSLGGKNTTWMRLEYNQINAPNIETLVKIACIMGISVYELISPLPDEIE